MKRVATCLNETDYKLLQKKLEQLQVTEYGLLHELLESFLQTGTIDKAKAKLFAKMALDYLAESGKEAKEIFDGKHCP
jgi:ATP phosphoribosyltransferase regulatory subunit HisZ